MISRRSQGVHNRGHGFPKIFNPAGVHNFTHTCQPTLNANVISPLPLEAGRGWKATLYSRANLSMILHVTPPELVTLGPSGRRYIPTPHTHAPRSQLLRVKEPQKYQHQTQHNVRSTGPWIDVHTLVVDRGPIPPRMVVCSVLVLKARTSVLVRQDGTNNHTQVAFHTSLTQHSSHYSPYQIHVIHLDRST